jgi:hypothetical protein
MSARAAASRFPARPISSSDLVAGGNRCRHVKKPIALLRLVKEETFLALMTAGGLLGPFLTGLLIDSSVSAKAGYEQAFQVIGVLALVGAVAAIVGMNPPRDARRIQEKVTPT